MHQLPIDIASNMLIFTNHQHIIPSVTLKVQCSHG
ncbi:hypothetical protein EVA_11039 [gut metagenome]|uniref:Uncharacterized protein n=1 Tax=gut metagenome TaxID=749906 RepID=J9GM24_9ZZZZ